MSRRWSPILVVIALAASAASGVCAQAPDPNASAIWQKVHADLFGDLVPIQVDVTWRLLHRFGAGLFWSYGSGSQGRLLRSLLCERFACTTFATKQKSRLVSPSP